MNEDLTYYEWDDALSIWENADEIWENSNYVSYTPQTQSTLYTAGEYVILANSKPYCNVEIITGVDETIQDAGTGTIIKKEFRYSVDSVTFSEFQEVSSENLKNLGSFDRVWFQFRYILLSGGPITISKAEILFKVSEKDPFYGYQAPAIQDENRVYAFPVIYKSNFLWEPYKMNRAVRLYKDLNLMVNSLFGHDVTYYRALAQGRSKDVFLMEYSLYEHIEGKCVKVIVPNNEFPDNKLNMGPFGVDFEMPFEVQIDKDYFQKIFGSGSGPQKRDVIYFPRTNRIYEVSSSYLFRDFMNEPLYFKVTLIKWLPKSNVENSETLDVLESYTNSAGKLFGELISQEEDKITNPQQFNVAYQSEDPVRSWVYNDQEISKEDVLNYYTMISESHYKMETATNLKQIIADVNTEFLSKGKTYFVRYSPSSSQPDEQLYYSMKKLTYEGKNPLGIAIFTYAGGNSQIESTFSIAQIFGAGSQFNIYEDEYDGSLGSDPVASCDTDPCMFNKIRTVEYKAVNDFEATQDRAFSAWFRLKDSTNAKIRVENFSFDMYTREITVNLNRPFLYFVGDFAVFTRTSGTSFRLFGEVSQVISPTSVKIKAEQFIIDYTQINFSSWTSFTDLQLQKSFPRVFLNSLKDGKGLKIELYENRHFRIVMNGESTQFSIPSNTPEIENGKWHALFITFSNVFKQLTLNLWKMQWDPVTKIPATTDLRLVYNKMIPLTPVNRSSDSKFFIEPSFMDLTNIRLFNRVAETDKQVLLLNQNIVKDAQWAIIIDNALIQTKLPYVGYTR